jgi:hypothetical protein
MYSGMRQAVAPGPHVEQTTPAREPAAASAWQQSWNEMITNLVVVELIVSRGRRGWELYLRRMITCFKPQQERIHTSSKLALLSEWDLKSSFCCMLDFRIVDLVNCFTARILTSFRYDIGRTLRRLRSVIVLLPAATIC